MVARTVKKASEAKADGKAEEKIAKTVQEPQKVAPQPSPVDNILCHYPQYERLYVSRDGNVWTEDTPHYLRKDAKLYENKYYTKK